MISVILLKFLRAASAFASLFLVKIINLVLGVSAIRTVLKRSTLSCVDEFLGSVCLPIRRGACVVFLRVAVIHLSVRSVHPISMVSMPELYFFLGRYGTRVIPKPFQYPLSVFQEVVCSIFSFACLALVQVSRNHIRISVKLRQWLSGTAGGADFDSMFRSHSGLALGHVIRGRALKRSFPTIIVA